MFSGDLFSILILLSAAIAGIGIFYICYKRFEFAIFLFLLTPWIFSAFYTNYPEWINAELQTGINGYLRGGALAMLGIIGLLKFITKWPEHRGKISLPFILLGVFLLLAFVSYFYSLDQRYTFIRASLFTTVFLFLLGLYSWLDSKEKYRLALDAAYYYILFMIVINLIALFVMPHRVWWWKTPSRFLGLWDHPNSMGGFFMLSYPVLFYQLEKSEGTRKTLVVISITFALLMHFLTGSRTTLLASIFGIGLWLFMNRKWTKLIYMTLILSVFVFLIFQFIPSSFQRGEGTGITTLTEREDLWQGAYLMIKQNLIKGYGYGVEAKIFAQQKLFDLQGKFFIASAQQPLHNGFLSILAGGGVFVFILWLSIIIVPIFMFRQIKDSTLQSFVYTIFFIVLLTNITENSLTGYMSETDLFFWFAWVLGIKASQSSLQETENMIVGQYNTLEERSLESV